MLARGGMAEVFLAKMSGVGGFAKLLVIKKMLPHLNDDPEFHEMFLNEGRVAARLNHPNVCQVYELGDVRGEMFLAMEYLEGLAWSELVALLPRGRGVELRVAATVLGQICEGLRYAHEFVDVDGTPMPIVHRDVTPQNLFITTEGVCKLLDFGVSKVLTEGSRTRSGMLKGKLPYMAPEQIRGEPIDARADVFSLGVVLWEAIAGTRLFNRESDYQIWKAITEDPIRPATAFAPGLPPQIDAVIFRALERDRDRRYPSVRQFAAELRDVATAVGGTFDTTTLAQIVKSLGAGRLSERSAVVGRAIGRPARHSDPPPLPAAITQPNPTIEPSVTSSIELRDASVKLRRKGRAGPIALVAGMLGAAVAIGLIVRSLRHADAPAAATPASDAAVLGAIAPAADAAALEAAEAPDEVEVDVADDPADGSAPGSGGDTPPKHSVVKRPKRRVAEVRKVPADAGVAEPGFYSVDSRPYATIYIDDRSYGATPLFKLQLPAGKHKVRAVTADGKSQRLSITIAPGKVFSSGTLTW